MIIAKIETFPLRIPFKPETRAAASAWGDNLIGTERQGQAACHTEIVGIRLIDLPERAECEILIAARAVVDTYEAHPALGPTHRDTFISRFRRRADFADRAHNVTFRKGK